MRNLLFILILVPFLTFASHYEEQEVPEGFTDLCEFWAHFRSSVYVDFKDDNEIDVYEKWQKWFIEKMTMTRMVQFNYHFEEMMLTYISDPKMSKDEVFKDTLQECQEAYRH